MSYPQFFFSLVGNRHKQWLAELFDTEVFD